MTGKRTWALEPHRAVFKSGLIQAMRPWAGDDNGDDNSICDELLFPDST